MTPAVDQVANLCCALEYYGESSIDNDLQFVRSPVNLPVFNMAVLLQPLTGQEEFSRRIAAAEHFFKSHHTGWSFWLCDGLVDRTIARRLTDLFDRHSMNCIADTPGMEIVGLPPLTRDLPNLECRNASRPTVLHDFCRIVSQSFNVPPESAARLYANPSAWGDGLQGWVGYKQQLPVATAVTAVRAGITGIYSVSTYPGYRRQGYAEVVMRHAMAQAQRASGVSKFVLQSSPAGRNLYRKMGFRKISRFLVFSTL